MERKDETNQNRSITNYTRKKLRTTERYKGLQPRKTSRMPGRI